MPSKTLCEITVKKIHQTDAAILVNDGDKEVWIPLSLCEIEVKDASKRIVEITLPEWWAQDKGLI
jgi:hypothetical protein